MAWAAARVKPRALGPTTSAKLCSGKLVAAGREPRSVVLFSVFSISVPHCPRAFTEPCLGSRCSSRCVCFVPARLVEAVASSPPSQGDSAPFFALGFGSEQRPTGVGPVQDFCKALCGVLQERQESARRLLEDIVGVVSSAGIEAGAVRGLQALRATLLTAVEAAQSDELREALQALQGLSRGEPVEDAPLARLLRRLFQRLGSTYVKLGQFIASSPTLFPAAYVREFQQCLDRTEPTSFEEIRCSRAERAGRPLSAVFRSFEEEPPPSGVDQVLVTGERVAVKVQKPGVQQVLQADLGFLFLAARTLELLGHVKRSDREVAKRRAAAFLSPELARTSVVDILSEIRSSMLDELDFTKEMDNLETFRSFLQQNGLERIAAAPRTFPEASGKKVLTMELFSGVPLTDLEGIRQYSNNPEQTLINALNVWSLSVRACEIFHADVHAGNLLVLEDGRVGFIDFGIVGRIPPKIWSAVEGFALSFAANDAPGMAKNLIAMGATDRFVDESALASDVQNVLSRIAGLQPEVVLRGKGDGRVVAEVGLDNDQVTELLLEAFEHAFAATRALLLRPKHRFGERPCTSTAIQSFWRRKPQHGGKGAKGCVVWSIAALEDLDPLRDSRVALGKGEARDEKSHLFGISPERDCCHWVQSTESRSPVQPWGLGRVRAETAETAELRSRRAAAAEPAETALRGLSAEVQEWIVDGPVQEVLGNLGCSSKTLAAAGLGSDVRSLTVLHIGFTPMALLPERFLVQFKSSRQRFGTGYSSAFASLYYLRGDAAARQMVMEPWRKNDHDKFIYDMGECTMKAITSHWMSGSTEKTQALNVGFDPLAEFLQSWQDARCRRVSEEDAYWRKHVDARDADIDAEDAAMAFTASTPSSLRPKHGAVPGWFVEPSSGCTEILCEATVGQLKILRLLINQDGEPIRAALHLQRASPLHEEVEEFDVTARELQPGEPLQ
ncbi:unnamed protein product [Symbiodinium sp. CCMP2456]|nr:unnamed protein product [Symbiodinium sp. CCMP2456]